MAGVGPLGIIHRFKIEQATSYMEVEMQSLQN